MPRCPACDKPVSLDSTPTAPFCSDRCRLIDLGRWLDESHTLPVRSRPGDPLDPDALEGHDEAASVSPDEPPDE